MQNLDQIAQTFQWAGERYMAIMQPFAERVFFALATIEIIFTAYQMMFEGEPVTIVLGNLAKKLLAFGFILEIATRLSGLQAYRELRTNRRPCRWSAEPKSESGLYGWRTLLFQTILRGFASLSWFSMSVAALVGLLAGLITFASFLLIAVEMVLTLAETYIGMAGGILLLGFQAPDGRGDSAKATELDRGRWNEADVPLPDGRRRHDDRCRMEHRTRRLDNC